MTVIRTGFRSRKITANEKLETLSGVTSLTISNYGNTVATVIIDNVSRIVPAFDASIGVPFGSFDLPGDGTACDIQIEIQFAGGTGDVILDYRIVKQQQEQC